MVVQSAAIEALAAVLAAEAPCWVSTAGSLEPYPALPGLELMGMIDPVAEQHKARSADG